MSARIFRTFSLIAILLILLAVVGCRQGVETGELQTKNLSVNSISRGRTSFNNLNIDQNCHFLLLKTASYYQ
jgi:hypothetical protein